MELEEAIKEMKSLSPSEAAIERILLELTINEEIIKDKNNHIEELKKAIIDKSENSIPKEIIEKYLKEETEKVNIYEKEADDNENLKLKLWHHMGKKNICEKLLGVEKKVTLDNEEDK